MSVNWNDISFFRYFTKTIRIKNICNISMNSLTANLFPMYAGRISADWEMQKLCLVRENLITELEYG